MQLNTCHSIRSYLIIPVIRTMYFHNSSIWVTDKYHHNRIDKIDARHMYSHFMAFAVNNRERERNEKLKVCGHGVCRVWRIPFDLWDILSVKTQWNEI